MFVVVVNFYWNQVEVFNDIWEAWHDIMIPIGSTVANNETFQIDDHLIGIIRPNLCKLVVLVNLPSQIRRVNTTIAFTWNEKWIISSSGSVLWELRIPLPKSKIGVLRLNHVIVYHIFVLNLPWREANASRWFQVNHTGIRNPWVWVFCHSCREVINHPRTVFLHEAEEGWASWTSVEPDEDWISFWVVLRLHENVMQLFFIIHFQITRVRIRWHWQLSFRFIILQQVVEFLSLWSSTRQTNDCD